ncbi:MAG TPA: hypothetical protein VIU61_18460 [Kofleriaceae bacterium]
MRAILSLSTVVGLLGTSGSAWALSQSDHAAITERSCSVAGFEHDFCERVSDEVYNTDYHEFLNLAAHAQPDVGDSACTAAGKSMQRLLDLGREMRVALREVKAQPGNHDLSAKLAKSVGRALHTIEDNCAHNGMPNPQHAWHSLSDTCSGTHDSPDSQAEALSCAEREAGAIFSALRQASSELGVDTSVMVPYETRRRWPPRGEVCAFLREAPLWDGQDRRWNNAVVVPAFRNQLASAITSDSAGLDNICANGETLERADKFASVNTSGGQELCFKLQAYCVGKADGEEEAPPWETDGEGEDEVETASGGCDAGNGAAGWFVLLLGAIAFGVTRRRR